MGKGLLAVWPRINDLTALDLFSSFVKLDLPIIRIK